MTVMKESKERFIRLLRGTGREGIENVVNVIGELGFFEAPASSRFHLNQQGGLLQHSLNVCDVAMNVRDMMIEMDRSLTDYLPIESVIIASLLRDTCKADIYRPTIKKQKTEMGVWVSAPGYDVDHSKWRNVDYYWYHDMHCAQIVLRYRAKRDSWHVSWAFTPW